MTDRSIYLGLAAAGALVAGLGVPLASEAAPAAALDVSAKPPLLQLVDNDDKRYWRHHHGRSVHVREPFTAVDVDPGTHVEAPFASVHVGRYGTWVRAPFVDLFVPH
jgi:hypothetical protein